MRRKIGGDCGLSLGDGGRMDIKAARRVSERTQKPVYDRLRGGPVNSVCSFWLAGRCTKSPCRFLHPESPPSQPPNPSQYRHSKTWQRVPNNTVKNSSISPSERAGSEHGSTKKAQKTVCSYWISGNCVHGEKCKHLHSWFSGNGFSLLAKLEGHNKAVTGIALPSGSNKLYSGSKDKTLRVWDCNSGQCVGVVNLLGEIGSMISEGPWVFVGLPDAVKAWNTQTLTDFTLNGPVGQVYAMALGNDMLFAGTQDGTILAWKSNSQSNCPELAASLKGHSHGVVSLVIGADRLYSGSMDTTIRVWDLNTFKCTQTLIGHTGVVMSVLCWESCLLSCSLDGTIKVWVATDGGDLEVTYTHKEDDKQSPFSSAHATTTLSCLYDLPLFTERGRLFAKQEVRAIQIGTGGLFFTGDATGQLAVWKLAGESSSAVAAS
ncbi:hypothetical protein HYC85_010887 [Camellia sinensis]|uniref:C3H1-type domain-containing protein n=1 Tax=Camellia sinensis TaxID=4442 RepID=A0A7J7HJB0_CAMSI|nr:hypothetical protein HYC85_010887 [Camellia sinensis]